MKAFGIKSKLITSLLLASIVPMLVTSYYVYNHSTASLTTNAVDKIEAVRDLIDFAHLSAHRSGRRVVMIDPADALNMAAANALLKKHIAAEDDAAGRVVEGHMADGVAGHEERRLDVVVGEELQYAADRDRPELAARHHAWRSAPWLYGSKRSFFHDR